MPLFLGTRRPLLLTGTTPAGPVLPHAAAIVSRFRTEALPVMADGAPVPTWMCSVSGQSISQATAASQPTYKLNRFGGKPTVLFNGSQFVTGLMSAANAALSAGECSMMVVYGNNQATTFGFIASMTNSTGFNISNSGSVVGIAAGYGVDAALTGFTTQMFTVTQNYNGLGARTPFFVNGMCISAGNSTSFTPSALGIGASATGVGGAKVEVLEVIIWNRRLTQYEAVQAEIAVRDYYRQPYPWASAAYIGMASGDSLTFGYGTTNVPQKNWVRLNATRHSLPVGAWANHGFIGADPAKCKAIILAERLHDITTLTGKPVKFTYFEFYNSKNNSLATSVALAQDVLGLIRGVPGNKAAFGTTPDYGAPVPGAEKSDMTNYWDVAANRAGVMDAYVPIHSDPNIGVTGACPAAKPFGHYFRNTLSGGGINITGCSITAGTNALTTSAGLSAGVYLIHASLPVDTYVTGGSAPNWTLNNNAIATVSGVTMTNLVGDGVHLGDDGHAAMAPLWDALDAA